jgi:hypothetical protein
MTPCPHQLESNEVLSVNGNRIHAPTVDRHRPLRHRLEESNQVRHRLEESNQGPSTQSPVSPAAAAAVAPAASNLQYLRLLLLLQSAAAAAAALAATLADAATAAWPPQGHQLFPGPGVSGTKLAGKKIGATANADGRHPGISRTKPGGDTMPKGSGAKPPRLCTKPVAAIGRSGGAVVIGLARRQRLPRLVGHDGVTEDDVEPRITSGR